MNESPTTAPLVALGVLFAGAPAAAAPGWRQVPFPFPVRCTALDTDISGWTFGFTFAGAPIALHYTDDTTGIAEPEDEPTERARVRVEPNALRDHAKAELLLPVRADVELAVHDCRGARVAMLAAGALAAGGHRFSWDAAESPDGVYCCRLACHGQRAAVRLTVVR